LNHALLQYGEQFNGLGLEGLENYEDLGDEFPPQAAHQKGADYGAEVPK